MLTAIFARIAPLAGRAFGPGGRIAGISARFRKSQKDLRPVHPVEPKRLTVADQWGFLTDIVKGAAARAEEAVQCHTAAMLQLDLAQYALTSLVDELSAVMNVGGRQRRATVYVFDAAAPSPPFRDAIAA